jgi:hypothetical protein
MIRFDPRPVSSATIIATLTANPAVFPNGSVAAPGIAWASNPDRGFTNAGGPQYFVNGGVRRQRWFASSVTWSSITDADGTADLFVLRDAANTLGQRNDTSAQTFRLYNTYTDALNYERGAIFWNGNVFQVRAENAGSGLPRLLRLGDTSNIEIDNGTGAVTAQRVGTTSAGTIFQVTGGALTNTSHLFTPLAPRINQASGNYTVLDVNPIETAVGARPHYLIRGRIGAASNVFSVDNNGNIFTQSVMQFLERTDPSAPVSNNAFLYCRDNGSGKTQLVARFPTGAVQVIATEP